MVQPGFLRLAVGRVPLIKFRKGGAPSAAAPAAAPALPSATSPTQVQSQPASAQQVNKSIEDWELPARYRRQAMSQQEIDMVNGGGIS